ncbi:MAG: hypothetical protein RLZZ383_670 [Pseudomonadota bacterium]
MGIPRDQGRLPGAPGQTPIGAPGQVPRGAPGTLLPDAPNPWATGSDDAGAGAGPDVPTQPAADADLPLPPGRAS